MAEIEVFKIQRPINPPDGPWLIYNRSVSYQGLVKKSELPENLVRLMGSKLKIYVEGFVDDAGQLQMMGRVDQVLTW